MRLFLALEIPAEIRAEIDRLVDRLRGTVEGWRWARAEGVHVTIRFLGEIAAGDDAVFRAEWSAAAAASAPVRLEIGGLGVFPRVRSPRVLWLGADETPPRGRLVALAAAIEERARRAGLPPEHRPFHAHVTLARARESAKNDPPPSGLGERLGEMDVRELVLFRSELGPGGSRYAVLERFPLGADAAARE